MASYVIMNPTPGEMAAGAETRLVRDGFSPLALVLPVVWLLWHRLWIEALAMLALILVLGALGEWTGRTLTFGAFSLLASLLVALEGASLRVWALRRRGWREVGAVDAHDEVEALMRFSRDGGELVEPVPGGTLTSRPGRGAAGPALGLLSYPGGR